MGASSKLLIDEHPLQVLPSLAVAIGLNEAMFVQQLHYWLKGKEDARDGRYFLDGRWWVYNTYEEWSAQFPFWSVETLKRVIRSAEKAGYVLSTSEYNERKGDQTKWYSIDREALDRAAEDEEPTCETPRATGQFDPPNVSNCPPQQVNLTRPLPETNAETNAEITDGGARTSETARAPDTDGEYFVGSFWSSLVAARGSRATPLDEQRPVPKRAERELERAAVRELGAGRDPAKIRLAARRMGLRWDEYPLDLAEALGDVRDGKPCSVEDEGAGREPPGPATDRREHAAERRRRQMAETFGGDDGDGARPKRRGLRTQTDEELGL